MKISSLRCQGFRALLFGSLISSSSAAITVFQSGFEDLTTGGDLNGQTSVSTVGSSTMSWGNASNGNMDVSTSVGDPNNAIATAGETRIYGSLDTATQATINVCDVVWFSLDMKTNHTGGTNRFGLVTSTSDINESATIGQRLDGIQARYAGWSGDANNASNNLPYTASHNEVFTQGAGSFAGGQWSANTWYTLVGKLTVNRGSGVNDTFQFWFLNDMDGPIDYENLGTPSVTFNTANLVEGSEQILGVVFDGNQGGNTYDNLTIAVPEPSALLLGGLGLIPLLRRRRQA